MHDAKPFRSRQPNWRGELGQYLADVARQAFRPGSHDCAMFAAGAVKAMTGHDPAAEWRGNYRTLSAGTEALNLAGYIDHVDFVAAHCPEVAPALAAVGDLAVMPSDGPGGALGVVQGASVYVLTPGGLALVNRLHIERAFRV